jgi:hypothetical protein
LQVEQLLDQADALIDSDAPSDALQKLNHILRIDDGEQLEFALDGGVYDRIEALKWAAEECQVRKRAFCAILYTKHDHFTRTGSGQP